MIYVPRSFCVATENQIAIQFSFPAGNHVTLHSGKHRIENLKP
jgi:hypothetical protein